MSGPWEKYKQPSGPWSKYGQSAPEVGVGEDVAKSAGAGLLRGGFDLGGTIADLNDAAGAGAGWLLEKTGASPQDVEAVRRGPLQALRPFMMGSQDIENNIEKVVGDLYEPKTTAGEFAQTGARFIPGALTGGSAKQAVGSAIKYGLAPGLASEAAGQLTEGSALEPWARAGTALAAGGAAGLAGDRANASGAVRSMVQNAPTNEVIKDTAQAAYKRADNAGLVVAQPAVDNAATRLVQTATNAGFHPKIHPKIQAALETAYDAGAAAQPLDQLELVRRVLGSAAKSMEADERRIASMLIDDWDDALDNLGPNDVLAGNPAEGAAALKEARANWHKLRKSELLDEALLKGERRAASTGSGGNEDNAIRQNIRGILDNPKKARSFSADEKTAMEKVVRGGQVQNLLRLVGKLSPQGSGLMAALGIGGAAINPMLAIPALAGAAAKPVANAMTGRNVDIASALIRSGGKMPQHKALPDRRALALALAGGQPLRPTE